MNAAHNIRRIVVGTDLSDRDQRAEARAAQLAREAGAELLVVTVREAGRKSCAPGVSDAEGLVALFRDSHGADLRVEGALEAGEPWRILLDQSERFGADVVVMGPGGEPTLRDALLGSTAEKLVHRAAMPVLIVRRRVTGPYQRIAAATDFSACSRHALDALAELLPGRRIALLHAYRVAFEGFISVEENQDEMRAQAQRQLDEFLAGDALPQELKARLDPELLYGTVQEALGGHAESQDLELVAFGAHGHTGPFEQALGGAAEALIRRLCCDALVVREPSRRKG